MLGVVTGLLVALVQAPGTCPACTTTGKEVHLCTPHAEEERAVLARVAKRLGSKEASERIAGLDELALATRSHVNAPSKRVADRLAAALEDESYEVRTHAAALLGPPQNALSAMAGLLDAFHAIEGEREKIGKEVEKVRAKQIGSPQPRESQLAELKRDEEAGKRKLEVFMDWRAALLAQLARFPDDRVVDAILRAPRGLALGGNEALLQLGSRDACKGVVESFRVWEEELARGEKTEAELDKASVGMDKALNDALREALLKELKERRAEGEAHQGELIRLAGERGLGPAPEASNRPAEAWKRWLDAHLEALPEHLPGVSSPVW